MSATYGAFARAAKVITRILTSDSAETGVYFDENGDPMKGSKQVHYPAFQDRVVAETRALLATLPPLTPDQ